MELTVVRYTVLITLHICTGNRQTDRADTILSLRSSIGEVVRSTKPRKTAPVTDNARKVWENDPSDN